MTLEIRSSRLVPQSDARWEISMSASLALSEPGRMGNVACNGSWGCPLSVFMNTVAILLSRGDYRVHVSKMQDDRVKLKGRYTLEMETRGCQLRVSPGENDAMGQRLLNWNFATITYLQTSDLPDDY